MGGDLITSPAQRVGVIDRWCCQIPTHPHPVPQGGIVGQTIDRCIIVSAVYINMFKGSDIRRLDSIFVKCWLKFEI